MDFIKETNDVITLDELEETGIEDLASADEEECEVDTSEFFDELEAEEKFIVTAERMLGTKAVVSYCRAQVYYYYEKGERPMGKWYESFIEDLLHEDHKPIEL